MAVQALGQVKSNIDSGVYRGIQDAALTALTGDQEWMEERNETYKERRDIILEALRSRGFNPDTPKAGLYVWCRIPEGYTSTEFTELLRDKIGVSLAPGSAYGRNGEGYMRISVGAATPKVREAMERFKEFDY